MANHNEKIQIKIEIDINHPSGFRVENQLIINPVSFYVLSLHLSDLLAGKIHAALYRAWKKRVKGRDWYDIAWYINVSSMEIIGSFYPLLLLNDKSGLSSNSC